MGSIWLILAAALVAVEGARKRGPDYPIGTGNLPTIKSNRRVLGSQEFSIALPKGPADNQEIFVLFISADKIDQGKKKLKSEFKDDEGHVMAEIVYRITPDDFFHANVQKTKVPETEAKLNREEATLTFIDNEGGQIAGFYWATVKEQEGDQITWYKDVGTAVRTVEKCAMETTWATGVDIEDGYGWRVGANGLEFNSKGFAPGTTFATCQFNAVPEVELTWSVEAMDGGKSKIEAKVPATEVALPETITCSMAEDDIEYDEDHCGAIINHKEVTSSPSRLEYAENVAPSSNQKVWTYMNATSTDQIFEFSCPLIDQAALVTVIGISQTGEKWVSHTINQVSNLLPEAHEDGFSCTEMHCWKVWPTRYDLKINMTTFAVGLHEFACKYMTGDITQEGDLVGYSRPHILLKYTENSSVNSLVAEWGLAVDTKTFIVQETDEHVNIANCLQKTPGKPAPMALKVTTGSSTNYFPRDFTEQHFISLNIPVPNTYDQAKLSCVYRNGDEEIESPLEPTVQVMFKPRNVEVVDNGETITCSAQVSSLDSLSAALSINDNFKIPMIAGVAVFNKTQHFTQAELDKSEKKGVSCTVESETFGLVYSSNVGGQEPTEPPSMEIEVNLGIPMLLLIGGAVGVLAICFKMKPAEKKGEGGKYKLADTEESDVIDESDPLSTAEKV